MRIAQEKWFYIPVVIIFMALFAMQGCKKEEAKFPEGTIAAVNGAAITQEDLDVELSMAQQQLADQGQPNDEQLEEIKKDLFESLITRKVLYLESQKKGVEVDDTIIDERFANMKEQFPKEADFKGMLEKMRLTEDLLKAQLREGMAIQQLIDQEIINNIEISDKETKDYYDGHTDLFKQPEKIRASHILIKADPGAGESVKADALKEIKKIQKELKEGGDFAALAKEHSQCPSAARGGDLGDFGRGQMVKPFEDAVFSMKSGEISDIVETDFGYHLIKAGERKPEMITDYKDIKDKLTQYLKQMKTGEEVKKYIEKLEEQAKIERFVPEPEVKKEDSAG
ncbi:MAG: peptidylprolyl isomerase [Deltaproteobacteria bacterium]|nr:peptidylprolyl isomerase [Deltaproteobacteria bacterium]MBW2594958.1 peptidylprolyl isomerase [Deltaproteobacteria bacterium]MBW2651083.1 peptidylprolyl isomerase [Deltaproteobacteria bacterium]